MEVEQREGASPCPVMVKKHQNVRQSYCDEIVAARKETEPLFETKFPAIDTLENCILLTHLVTSRQGGMKTMTDELQCQGIIPATHSKPHGKVTSGIPPGKLGQQEAQFSSSLCPGSLPGYDQASHISLSRLLFCLAQVRLPQFHLTGSSLSSSIAVSPIINIRII